MTSAIKDDQKCSAKRVAVVGAGVSGLAAAYKLKVHGLDVTIFEAEDRAGGKLRSIARDGLIWDEGANTMTESELDVSSLLDNLGLREKQQFPMSQHKRYIARDGTPVLLQLLLEPFLWKKSMPATHESVGGFFQRHFGKEVVDYLIDPVVAGISGGDPESLSMRHAFPELWDLEKRFGSIISGAIRSKLSAKGGKVGESASAIKKRRRGSFSFVGGMQAPLSNVKEMKIMKRGNPFLLDFIPEVNYMPISVIITTFKKENVKLPLEGFGVLVPSKEQQNGLKTLGTLFSSMMFPDRAPKDLYLYTTFVGGSRNKELAKASRDELKAIVTSDLRQLLGATGEPAFFNHYYWSKAFPLYGHNYDSVIEAVEKMEQNLPGYFYAGNHKGGLSVGKAISSGCKAAEHVISYLDSSFDGKLSKENCC